MAQRKRQSRAKRVPWWRREIDEEKFGLLGTRLGVILVLMTIAGLVENAWLGAFLVVATVTGVLVAYLLRRDREGDGTLSIVQPRDPAPSEDGRD